MVIGPKCLEISYLHFYRYQEDSGTLSRIYLDVGLRVRERSAALTLGAYSRAGTSHSAPAPPTAASARASDTLVPTCLHVTTCTRYNDVATNPTQLQQILLQQRCKTHTRVQSAKRDNRQ